MKHVSLAAAVICLGLPAHSQAYMDNTPAEILSVAQMFGQAQMDTPDGDGRPVLSGTIDGTNYGILVYGCENNTGCDSVQFFATFETSNNSLEFINQWNFDKRFSSAYLREDGDVVLNFSTNLDFGVSRENFEDSFDIWALLLGQFTNRINGRPDDGGGTK